LEKRTKEFDVKTFTTAEGSDQAQIASSEGMIDEKSEKNCKMHMVVPYGKEKKSILSELVAVSFWLPNIERIEDQKNLLRRFLLSDLL
jgi:hypothetical protein